MNKPKLTKEQAKSMEEIVKLIGEDNWYGTYDSKATVVKFKLEGQVFSGERSAANWVPNDDFIAALYIGYEVELTPEEKVKAYYDELRKGFGHCSFQPDDYRSMGAKTTLELLGIKIEGVNA
jgi:hypothetical protein